MSFLALCTLHLPKNRNAAATNELDNCNVVASVATRKVQITQRATFVLFANFHYRYGLKQKICYNE